MPDLIKLYIRHSMIGFGIAAVFVGLLLYFNIQNLWTLVSRDEAAVLAVFILWFFNGVVFASVQFAYAVMSLAEKSDRSGGGGLRRLVFAPQRALIRVSSPRSVPPRR